MKRKILYVSGHVAEYPEALRPLPPLDSKAPHSNMFRLTEYIGKYYKERYILDVVSPRQHHASNPDQLDLHGPLFATYYSIRISERWRHLSCRFQKTFRYNNAVLQRFLNAPSLQGLYYLQQVERLYLQLKPDIVIHDEGPQYIKGLARFVPRDKLYFYCRGDMGLSRRDLHRPSAVITTNYNLSDWVRSVNPCVTNTFVVPNSLNPTFENLPLNLDRFTNMSRPKKIIFVGRIVPVKGVRQLLEAFLLVLRHYKNPLTLEIIGGESLSDGRSARNNQDPGFPESFEHDMRTLAHSLLPAESVKWRGWLSQDELLAVYQSADLAVYPSTCIEGFGMVALEAMSCGVPVIASKRPGFESLLSQGRGILIDPDDIEELATAILKVITDTELAQKLSKEGHQEAQRYTVRSAAEALVTILEN